MMKSIFVRRAARKVSFISCSLVLLSLFVLAGCGAPASGGTGNSNGGGAVSGPPPSLQTILDKFKHPGFTDASCTIETHTAARTVDGVAIPASSLSGECETTTNPDRNHTIIHFTTSTGTKHTVEGITDTATSISYTKSSIDGGPVPTKWTKTSLSELEGASSSPFLSLDSMKNPTLVGADTINGVAVWHVRGQADLPSASGLKENLDCYLRQDNQYPLEIKGTITGSMQSTTTLLFTKYNSGITIALPPADQVTSN